MFLGLRTLIFQVPDVHVARDWYQNLLGYAAYFDQPFYVGFNVGGYELGLVPEDGPVTRGDTVFAYWGVEDVAASLKSLVERGATVFEEPQDVGGGIITASLKDPWGNLFGIIDNPHFKLPA